MPRRDPKRPNIYLSVAPKPTRTWQEAMTRRQQSARFYRSWMDGPLTLTEEVIGFPTRLSASRALASLKYRMARLGFTVNPDPAKTYRLYVVRLDGSEAGFPGEECLYVGQTFLPIEARFEQHVSGVKAAKKAKAFRQLDDTLTPRNVEYYSSWDAKVEEYKLGESLRKKGFRVFGPSKRELGIPDDQKPGASSTQHRK